MAKSVSVSPYVHQALTTLGSLIRTARISRRWTQRHLGEVCALDRRTIAAIESGKPEVSIGNVFMVASVVDIHLFDADETVMARLARQRREIDTLLPRRVTMRDGDIDDDF